jgi:hypothetical protein
MRTIKIKESRKKFDNYIRNLINTEHKLIYKSNLELMRNYYEFLFYSLNDLKICDKYLNLFTSIENINVSNIESNFSNLILSEKLNHFNLEKIKNVKDAGIYFIYDENDEMIYIGKSNNLNKRALQSFINKLPLGSYSLKLMILESESINLFEAIAIDYFLPIYNNKLENLPKLRHRTYVKLINHITDKLNELDIIYPLKRNLDEITISVFENI